MMLFQKIVGFDTKHCDDNKFNWNVTACIAETLNLLEQLENYGKSKN